jgi:hypothetical protein
MSRSKYKEGDVVWLKAMPAEDGVEAQPREKCEISGTSGRGMYIGYVKPTGSQSAFDDGLREFHVSQIEGKA